MDGKHIFQGHIYQYKLLFTLSSALGVTVLHSAQSAACERSFTVRSKFNLIRGYEAVAVIDTVDMHTTTLISNIRTPSIFAEDACRSEGLEPLTTRQTAKLALAFCLIWFAANWSVNASLEFTSVASSTILSSTSGFFTLVMGRVFKVETMSLVKIIAVTTSFLGVVLVSVSDSASAIPHDPAADVPGFLRHSLQASSILGDFLALLSALCYALYVILLKVKIKEESRIDMQLFFGFVGLFNILMLWPIGLILHLTGVEPLTIPPSGKAWTAVLINMFITVSSDYIYVIAMLKTTPLLVTIGLSLTIPIAIVGDYFLKIPTAPKAIFGAVLVLGAFALIGVENGKNAANNGKDRVENAENAPDTGRRT
ncbi:hypothetical protein EW145_g3249 [Phellinidium pouzarii]|uniref:EamA domain-containing protein n=1 Tax=Phellinidium pouzarii TaxID=167371 RepID=A0A4V3XCY3_9AGAM|nr:hypothetical protein EW145_g3249 [Phellinidium pouzarii]